MRSSRTGRTTSRGYSLLRDLFFMSHKTHDLQVRSTFDPPEADRRLRRVRSCVRVAPGVPTKILHLSTKTNVGVFVELSVPLARNVKLASQVKCPADVKHLLAWVAEHLTSLCGAVAILHGASRFTCPSGQTSLLSKR